MFKFESFTANEREIVVISQMMNLTNARKSQKDASIC